MLAGKVSKQIATLILQPRKTKREYVYDYFAKIVEQDEEDVFGKGGGIDLSEELAKRKAISEAVERYCGSRPNTSFRRATYKEIENEAIDPRKFIHFADFQYTKNFPYKKFDPRQKLNWIRGESLLNGREIWVPAFAVYLGYNQKSNAIETRYAPNISCGLATHTSIEKAAEVALFELVERDAAMLSWLYKRCPSKLDLESIQSPELRYLREKISDEGLQLTVVDSSIDVPIFSMIAILSSPIFQTPVVSFGMSSGIHFEETASKAVLEAVMMRNTLDLLVERDEMPLIRTQDVRTFLDHAIYYSNATNKDAWVFLTQGILKTSKLLSQKNIKSKKMGFNLVLDYVKKAKEEAVLIDLTHETIRDMGLHCVRILSTSFMPMNFDHNIPFLGSNRLNVFSSMKDSSVNMQPHPFT